jgi:hypothetical protein
METGKHDMSRVNLNRLSGEQICLDLLRFAWHCLSGGLLLDINTLVLDLSIIVEGEFFFVKGPFGTASLAASGAVSDEAVPNGVPKQLR